MEAVFQLWNEHIPDKSRFPGTTDAGYADQAVQGNVDGKILEIVLGRTTQFEPPVLALGGFGSSLEGIDGPVTSQILAGEGCLMAFELGGWALKHQGAATFSVAWTYINDLIGLLHHAGFMFDDDHRVLVIPESLEQVDQSVGISGMESDAGFIEHIKGVDQPAAQTAGEIHAFSFSPR